jgi:hypothetical protein
MQSLSEPIMAEVQTQSRQIREAAQPPTATASTAALPAAVEPLAQAEQPVEEPVAAAPAENASTAEALVAAAEAAEQSQEDHAPVPMSVPDPPA